MAISRISQSTVQAGFPKFNNTWDGLSAVGAMEPISAITLSASSASVEFNNIPSTYSHLQIRVMLLSTDVSKITFNNDSSSNYNAHGVRGSGSSVSSYSTNSGNSYTFIQLGTNAPSSAVYSQVCVVDILDYASTSKYKTVRTLWGYDTNNTSSGQVEFISGLWMSASAITSLTFANNASHNQNSSFTLYGIK
jgi:hypothetical protein